MTMNDDILTDISADTNKSKLQIISTDNPNGWDWTQCLVDNVVPVTDTNTFTWDWNVHPYTEYAGLDIIETGDYSMLVKGVRLNHKIISVKGIKVVESIDTPEGTILYFDEKLPDELRYYNVIYAKAERDYTMGTLWEEFDDMMNSLKSLSIRNNLKADISSK